MKLWRLVKPLDIILIKSIGIRTILTEKETIQARRHRTITQFYRGKTVENRLYILCGRGDWTRTSDLTVPNRVRYQLCYAPMILL